MGPGHSSELTVIGDTVNVAAHLEAHSKELGCTVVASAATADHTGDGFTRGKRERIRLKGRLALMETVEILGFVPRQPMRDSADQPLPDNVIALRLATA